MKPISSRLSLFAVSVALLLSTVLCCEPITEVDSGFYLFLGADVSVRWGRGFFPIKSVDKKHLYVDNGNRLKKLPMRAFCALRREWVLTANYIEVLEMKTSTYLLNDQSELDAMAYMMDPGSFDEYGPFVQEGWERGDYNEDAMSDSISIDASFIPQANFENVYMVACLTYDRLDPETGENLGRNGRAKVHFLGGLRQGEISRVRFTSNVGRFAKAGSKITMYWYSENGDPIALSNGRYLRLLTPEQVQRFRALADVP